MLREVEAKVLVVVKHWRVNRAVEESKNGVWSWADYERLYFSHNEVMVRLKNGAGRHGRIVNYHSFLVVVDVLDFVAARRGCKEQVTAAVKHAAKLRRPTPVIHAKRVAYVDAATGGSAGSKSEGRW